MIIKELLDQVRSQIGGEAAAKAESVLKNIERGVLDLQEDIKSANSESKERKIKIRELESQLTDKDAEIEGLKKKADTSEVKKEVESLREFKSRTLKAQRDSFTTKLETISKHPNFEKVKPFLSLPEPAKDGKYDLSKLEDTDLEVNMTELGKFEAAGLFGPVEKQGVDGTPRTEKPEGGGKPAEVKDERDFSAHIDQVLGQY